jgi:hypothetical protein
VQHDTTRHHATLHNIHLNNHSCNDRSERCKSEHSNERGQQPIWQQNDWFHIASKFTRSVQVLTTHHSIEDITNAAVRRVFMKWMVATTVRASGMSTANDTQWSSTRCAHPCNMNKRMKRRCLCARTPHGRSTPRTQTVQQVNIRLTSSWMTHVAPRCEPSSAPWWTVQWSQKPVGIAAWCHLLSGCS